MASKNERYQAVWREFEQKNGHVPVTLREAVEWGVRLGKLSLPDVDPYDILSEDMSKALREEYKTDRKGRRYRVNHAVRVTRGGVQYTFWAVMGFAPPQHMERAFAQRREQIVGDCVQLKTDVDAYNDMAKPEMPLQIVLDFTEDVAERQYWQEDEAA
jgi:hypothetical protein